MLSFLFLSFLPPSSPLPSLTRASHWPNLAWSQLTWGPETRKTALWDTGQSRGRTKKKSERWQPKNGTGGSRWWPSAAKHATQSLEAARLLPFLPSAEGSSHKARQWHPAPAQLLALGDKCPEAPTRSPIHHAPSGRLQARDLAHQELNLPDKEQKLRLSQGHM